MPNGERPLAEPSQSREQTPPEQATFQEPRDAADPWSEAMLSQAPFTQALASALAGADPATRARTVQRLQRERGNTFVERVLTEMRSEETAPEQLDPGTEDLAERINRAAGGGEPLDPGARHQLEEGLRIDLGSVRVHADQEADHLARSVDAVAFTTGSDMFFRRGAYRPGSRQGRYLLAHEAAHVVQQRAGPVAGQPAAGGIYLSDPADDYERDADTLATRLMAWSAETTRGPPVAPTSSEKIDAVTCPQRSKAIQRCGVMPCNCAPEEAHALQRKTVCDGETGECLEDEATGIGDEVANVIGGIGPEGSSAPAFEQFSPEAGGGDPEAAVGPCEDIVTPHRLLVIDSVHPAVREAQRKLNLFHNQQRAAGGPGLRDAPLVPDCVFGKATFNAVFSFQQQVFPDDPRQWDGQIGDHTWAELDKVGTGPPPIVPPFQVPNLPPEPAPAPTPQEEPAPPPSPDTATTHYRVEIKAWIPHDLVADPEEPIRSREDFDGILLFTSGDTGNSVVRGTSSNHHSRYEGNHHSGYDGEFKAFAAVDFDWNGSFIQNFAIFQGRFGPGEYGPTHRHFSLDVTNAQFNPPVTHFTGVEAGQIEGATSASQLSGQGFTLGMSSGLPNPPAIAPGGGPNIDADWTVAISTGTVANLLQVDELRFHFQTDRMPSHGFAVFANGQSLTKEIVNDISAINPEGIAGAADILARLTDQTNNGDRTVTNALTGRIGSSAP